jgi:hypothetical protein
LIDAEKTLELELSMVAQEPQLLRDDNSEDRVVLAETDSRKDREETVALPVHTGD